MVRSPWWHPSTSRTVGQWCRLGYRHPPMTLGPAPLAAYVRIYVNSRITIGQWSGQWCYDAKRHFISSNAKETPFPTGPHLRQIHYFTHFSRIAAYNYLISKEFSQIPPTPQSQRVLQPQSRIYIPDFFHSFCIYRFSYVKSGTAIIPQVTSYQARGAARPLGLDRALCGPHGLEGRSAATAPPQTGRLVISFWAWS